MNGEVLILRAALMKWEEREAACCPEDVSFEEVIRSLRRDRAALANLVAEQQLRIAEEHAAFKAENERALDLIEAVQALEAKLHAALAPSHNLGDASQGKDTTPP